VESRPTFAYSESQHSILLSLLSHSPPIPAPPIPEENNTNFPSRRLRNSPIDRNDDASHRYNDHHPPLPPPDLGRLVGPDIPTAIVAGGSDRRMGSLGGYLTFLSPCYHFCLSHMIPRTSADGSFAFTFKIPSREKLNVLLIVPSQTISHRPSFRPLTAPSPPSVRRRPWARASRWRPRPS
jgi:hypothetical protein